VCIQNAETSGSRHTARVTEGFRNFTGLGLAKVAVSGRFKPSNFLYFVFGSRNLAFINPALCV
jgi:hypothetical protein